MIHLSTEAIYFRIRFTVIRSVQPPLFLISAVRNTWIMTRVRVGVIGVRSTHNVASVTGLLIGGVHQNNFSLVSRRSIRRSNFQVGRLKGLRRRLWPRRKAEPLSGRLVLRFGS